jgi:hypothetical protein
MPVIVPKAAAPQPRREGVRVPGIYEGWIRAAAESWFAIEDDPRFTYDHKTGFSTGASEEEVAAAKKQAARFADDRIAEGGPLIAKLLQCERRCWGIPFFRDRATTKYDIYRDDTVYVNAEATRVWREHRPAGKARQAALRAQPVIEPEHNGATVAAPECAPTFAVEHVAHELRVFDDSERLRPPPEPHE